MLVISYNLRKHRAISELAALDERYQPDVICLQECDTGALAEEVGRLRLAHSTTGNRLGLAMYFNPERLEPRAMRAFALKKSLHDRILRPAHERLLGARMVDLAHGRRELIVASFHAAPLTALNSLRRHQIRSALGELQFLGPGLPTLMVGDYNYPVFKENLADKVQEAGYELTLSDSRTYTRYKFFRGHYDFATSAGFEMRRVQTLPRGSSDHLPILVDAEYAGLPLADDIDVVI
ncbi:endonuclease/exonuclease/phosphatase family protein [Agromyces intestinalis]|uniref:Endonuclease/exonuclease/phosphatase family protein n=1 Tax=Agromyces intestinalis TaxID=2592652 RepID=A0A5C1YE34_9MICO|nr:endonuclease/exonuclease/phosphatase family protein [Agromyces intestinalis]QEO13790.1 endonuclease/exonuclease/phosphatase family protein [Agromyces intestinalis]